MGLATLLLFPFGTRAATIQVDSQNNLPIEISQGVSLSIASSDDRTLTIETFQDKQALYWYITPLDAVIEVTVTADDTWLVANKKKSWVDHSFKSSDHQFALWLKPPKPVVRSKLTYLPDPGLMPSQQRYSLRSDALLVSSNTQLGESAQINANSNGFTPERGTLISWSYEISNPNRLPLVIDMGYNDTSATAKKINYFDRNTLAWHELPTTIDAASKRAYTFTSNPYLIIAIVADDSQTLGLASWYDQSRYRSFGYKGGNFAAHRDYPKGTQLKVTRISTGKSIIVTVNDWGPEIKTGRILDLEKQAYNQLASLGSGQMTIRLEKING